MDKHTLQLEFENVLSQKKFDLRFHHNDIYNLIINLKKKQIIQIQPVCSKTIDKLENISQNEIESTTSKGLHLTIPEEDSFPDYFIFSLSYSNDLVSYFILKYANLIDRDYLRKITRIPAKNKVGDLSIWIISIDLNFEKLLTPKESTWHLLGKGIHGVMNDNIKQDYSKFRNGWDGLAVKFGSKEFTL